MIFLLMSIRKNKLELVGNKQKLERQTKRKEDYIEVMKTFISCILL